MLQFFQISFRFTLGGVKFARELLINLHLRVTICGGFYPSVFKYLDAFFNAVRGVRLL